MTADILRCPLDGWPICLKQVHTDVKLFYITPDGQELNLAMHEGDCVEVVFCSDPRHKWEGSVKDVLEGRVR